MAATRLRKAFRYPSEADSDQDEELDEEHQEQLISTLQAQDAQKNTLYRRIFLLVPGVGALYSLTSFLLATSTRQRLPAVLSLTSQLCTAYILQFQPLTAPERKGKRAVYKVEAAQGPVEKYLVFMNAALGSLMLVVAMLSWRQGKLMEAWPAALPAAVFGLVMVARQMLAPLDFDELQKARYEYKGA